MSEANFVFSQTAKNEDTAAFQVKETSVININVIVKHLTYRKKNKALTI